MENQPFRKQLIYNWNETLFLNMAFFCQFRDRANFHNVSFAVRSTHSNMYIKFKQECIF